MTYWVTGSFSSCHNVNFNYKAQPSQTSFDFFKSLIRCSAVTLSKICFTGLNFVIICHGETLAFSADSFFSPHRNKHLRISDLHFYIWKWFFHFLHQLPFWLLTKSLPPYHVTFEITSFSFFCVSNAGAQGDTISLFYYPSVSSLLFFSSRICYHVMKGWRGRTSIWICLFSSTSCVCIRVLNI